MSIVVNNVTKLYNQQKALDSVSFSIPTGEVVGLLGPNGAGKSTLMKIITGYIKQTDGAVEVNGNNTLNTEFDFRAEIGYLPENNPLYVDMYVKEYLLWVASIYKLGKTSESRVKELIDITGIGYEQNKKIGSLSKGYRQRVGLAQALIHNPKLLILDEPTSGLDPNQIIEIRNLIYEIGKDKTVILSTHIMQEVEAICKRIIIINRGKLVADGSTNEVRALSSGFGHQVLVEFVEDVAEESLLKIQGVQNVYRTESSEWVLISKEGIDIRPNIFSFAKDNGYTLLTLSRKSLQLEEVFQNLTQPNHTNN
ncbi:MAG TPA: gliding motility-associated ABC transporter ATP-binding subunit GldA [Tenuifilaceae bacterium]|nr:gliding motility-associated ABC transporter ATP-binding subunit GldA [Tenuifilaceae bacterium]